MTHQQLIHRQHQARRARAGLRLRARQLRAAAVGGAVALGAVAAPGPAAAAVITINTAVNGTQLIGGGNDLEITAGGSITAPGSGDDGVRESAAGASIGSISNAGSIGAADDGIQVDNSAIVAGSISNTGSITADGEGVLLRGGASVQGSLSNDGLIAGGDEGIQIAGATVSGNIGNTGTITANGDGVLLLSAASVQGSIRNAGSIEADEDGVKVTSSSTVGGIRNSGGITAGDHGIRVWTTSAVDGDITNAAGGQITSGYRGIYVDTSTVQGTIANAGTIVAGVGGTSGGQGISIGWGSSVGAVENTGSLTAADDEGIFVDSSTVANGIRNAGDINAMWGIAVQSSSEVSGGIVNDTGGVIDAGDVGIIISRGRWATDSTVINGGVRNAGTIRSSNQAGYGNDGIGVYAGTTVNDGITNAAGGRIDTATNNGDDGIAVEGGNVFGGIGNAGHIDSASDGIRLGNSARVRGALNNDGTINAAEDGIRITRDAWLEQDLVNAGTIEAGGRGIAVNAVGIVYGNIINTGTITSAGTAIEVSLADVYGGISNAGTVTGGLNILGDDGTGRGIDVTNTGHMDLVTSTSTIFGDFSQPSGTLAMTLLSFGDYTGVPLLTGGDLVLGGELLLNLDPGFAFSALDRLTLMFANGTRTGTFSNYADGDLVYAFDSRRRVYLEYTADGVDLYTTPLPGTWALIGLGLFGWSAARARRRTRGGARGTD